MSEATALNQASRKINDMVIANVLALLISYVQIWVLILFKGLSDDLADAATRLESQELAAASKHARNAFVLGLISFIAGIVITVIAFQLYFSMFFSLVGNPSGTVSMVGLFWPVMIGGFVVLVLQILATVAQMNTWRAIMVFFTVMNTGDASALGTSGSDQLVKASKCTIAMVVAGGVMMGAAVPFLGMLSLHSSPYTMVTMLMTFLVVMVTCGVLVLILFIAWLVYLFTGLPKTSKAFGAAAAILDSGPASGWIPGPPVEQPWRGPTKAAARFCSTCGVSLPGDPGARFCPACGASLP